MKLALKIDVNTYLGTRDGVPRLIDTLKAYDAGATFLFTLGPDRSGRAVRRLFHPGVFSRAWRNQTIRNYGLRTLFYGTLLPAPDIGTECADIMRRARDAGFEVGIHGFDRVLWQRKAAGADAEWTRRQMDLACARFEKIFGEPARVHGAAGWQMNRYAYRLTQRLGFGYCSDTRGSGPFVPIYQAEIVACPQVPTTLPTLDELIGLDGVTAGNVAKRVLELTREVPETGHVYTAQAELEGRRLAPAFEKLLEGWHAQGYELASLRDYLQSLEKRDLPRHEVAVGPLPGRAGAFALQGRTFLDGA
ncbi:MAG: polysaccharide deacetylase family protein [Betaproteobacteria bacterium]